MIGTLDIKCFAAKPQMPLQPMFAFAGSPSSIRVMDVPKKIGDWEITGVKVAVTYPDNRTIEKSAVRTGSVWVATLEGSELAGKVGEGFSVLADGTDEDGNEVTGYVLGKGDVFILENRNDIKSLVGKVAVRFLEDMPTSPAAGDMIEFNGMLKFYDGEKWVSVSTPTKISQLENDVGYITESALPSKVSELENDVGYITASAIPSDVSAFNNDAGYITESAIPSNISAFNNDVGYITAGALPSKVSELDNDAGYLTADSVTISELQDTVSNLDGEVSYQGSEIQRLDEDLDQLKDMCDQDMQDLWDQIDSKQNALSNSQLQALAYTTDELQTVVTYSDNTTVAYDKYGQLERGDIAVAGKTISSIKIGKGVTSLGLALFLNDKTTLTSATIPDTVTYIGIGAFDGCANLVSIEIPESVTSVGDKAFRGCTSLQTAKVKMSGAMNTNMFYGCTSLQNLEIGNGVTSIAADAFHGCTSLTSIAIPDSVRVIGNQAFNACTGLLKVDTGNGVTRIYERAFRECTNLKEVNVGDSVTTIDESAFAVCPSLEKVTIGESVATISYNAFSGSTSALTEVLFKEKTLAEVQAMAGYPWDIADTSIIKTWNDATQEWVNQEYRGKSDLDYTNVNWNSDTAQFGIDYFTLNFGGYIFTLNIFQTGKHTWTNTDNQFKVVASDKNNFIVTQPPYNDRTIATFTRNSESEVSWNLTSSQESGSSTFTVTAYPLTSTKIALSNSVPTKTSDLVNDSGFIDTVPTVNNGTLYIYQNNILLGTFTANQHGSSSINITGGGDTQNQIPVSVELADPSGFPSDVKVGNLWFQVQDVGYWYVSLNGINYAKMNSIQSTQSITVMVQPNNGQIEIDAPYTSVWDGSSWNQYSGYAVIDVSNVEWISVLAQQ